MIVMLIDGDIEETIEELRGKKRANGQGDVYVEDQSDGKIDGEKVPFGTEIERPVYADKEKIQELQELEKQKGQEVAMVFGPHAAVEIGAVMVETDDADVARATVLCAEGPDDLTSLAIVRVVALLELLEHFYGAGVLQVVLVEDTRGVSAPHARV